MIPRALGVFGDPIAHSKSPAMHMAAMAALGLPHHYLPFHVHADRLETSLRGAAALGFLGVNLTVPHKRNALALMDRLDDTARRIGAVNTVAFRDGTMVGHNTDGWGFRRAMDELHGASPRRAVVLGSGGASLAVVDALLSDFPELELWWVSRDPSRIVRHPASKDPRVVALDYTALTSRGPDAPCELWVNTTTVGMHGGPVAFPSPLPFDQLVPSARVIDIVYPRPAGGLLDLARARGHAVADGRPMLLWQGVRALEIWLDRELPETAIAAMAETLGISPYNTR